MTDRELLELAARAAGISGTVIEDRSPVLLTAEWGIWNPLNSDGDALRLAVKLRLWIQWNCTSGLHVFRAGSGLGVNIKDTKQLSDASATVRELIVRAAAEIGKEMK